MNKFAEPSLYGTTSANSEPETLTFEVLKETVDALRAQYPYIGMEVVESPFLPEGMTMLESSTQYALCQDGKIMIIDKPDLFKPMMPR